MKLIEFTAVVRTVGGDVIRLVRKFDGEASLVIPATPDEQRSAGAHLYERVRVTVETIEDEVAPRPAQEIRP
jgi:hypothetical protein